MHRQKQGFNVVTICEDEVSKFDATTLSEAIHQRI